MSNELVTLDTKAMADAVQEKIKLVFMMAIPDDKFNELVKNEIDGFFKRGVDNGYGNNTDSIFDTLVKERLIIMFKDRINEVLNEKFRKHGYDSETGKNIISEAVEEILIKNSGAIIQCMLKEAVQSLVNNLRV